MKFINILILSTISLLIVSNVIAEENKFKEIVTKLDTIVANQDKFIKKTINSPLNNRKNGVELNLARLLMLSDNYTSLSVTYSRFDHEEGVEWAYPVYFLNEKNMSGQQTNVTTLDVHYRKFLGDSVRGFYISGFSRLTHINGPIGEDYVFSTDEEQGKQGSEIKLGVGVGIGYRIFSTKNYYWGTSLSVGRNFLGENDKFTNAFIDDSEFIFDMELLKFGYSF